MGRMFHEVKNIVKMFEKKFHNLLFRGKFYVKNFHKNKEKYVIYKGQKFSE